jgi:SAM-dependent methyltransferase
MRKLLPAFGLAAVAFAAVASSTPGAGAQDKEPDRPAIVVPYVPTARDVVTAMLKTAAVKDGDTVYDLGCGDGRIVITAVKDFKAKRGLGIDFNPERLKDCQKSMADAKLTPEQTKAITFKQGDVLKMTKDDFKDVDVVTLYLLPSVNRELKPTLKAGLKAGARVVSHDFDMGDDWPAEKTVNVTCKDDNGFEREHRVFLWTIK